MSLVSVVGATGRQGLAQIRQLGATGHKVRALSRSETPDLGGSNIADENRVFDLYDESTWVPAFEGSDAVFYTHPLQAREDRATLTGRIAATRVIQLVKRFAASDLDAYGGVLLSVDPADDLGKVIDQVFTDPVTYEVVRREQ